MPLALPAVVAAFLAGVVLAGSEAGWSAAIAMALVFANFVAHGLSLEWAAGISPTVLYAVGLGGFVVRLAVIIATVAVLRELPWFSVTAFAASIVPGTLALLAFEAKHLGGRMQADLWMFGERG